MSSSRSAPSIALKRRSRTWSRAALLAPLAIALALSAGALAGHAHAQAFGLGVRLAQPTGTTPIGLAVGDVNSDGALDLVSADNIGSVVSVMLGDGRGGFGPRTDFATGTSPLSVALGDLDGDGHLDIVVTNLGSGTISVLLGNGPGGFGPKTDFPCAGDSRSLVLGDLNGDGRLDAIVCSYSTSVLSILLGNGAGGFLPRTDIPCAAGPYRLALGDVNGDGRLDLAVANYGAASVSVFPGNGAGGFGARTDLTLSASGTAVTLADVNRDGKLDIVAASYPSNKLGVFLGNGSGGFGARTDYTTGSYPSAIAIADLDGNGYVDAAVCNYLAGTVTVLPGGVSGFGAGTDVPTEISAASNPQVVVAADFNGDGHADLAVSNSSYNEVAVLLAAGGVAFGPHTDFASSTSSVALAVGDLNGDGHPDLALSNASANVVSIALGDGAGGFGPRTDFNASTYAGIVSGAVIGDLDGDGRADLAVSGSLTSVVVMPGNGVGSFGTPAHVTVGSNALGLAIADVNGDGHADLVDAEAGGTGGSALLSDGSGGFPTRFGYGTVTAPLSFAVGDLTRDGKLDVVVVCHNVDSLFVCAGYGFGTFAPPVGYATGPVPVHVELADVNGDGALDVVTADNFANISVRLNNGAGALGARVEYAAGGSPVTVKVLDLNGDGRPDLLVGHAGSASTILLGDGAGGFGPPVTLANVQGVQAAVAADFNGDGAQDIAVTNGNGTTSAWIALARTQTTLAATPTLALLGAPLTLSASIGGGTGPATGSVRFLDGATPLGTAPVVGGVAALSLFAPYLGTRTLGAVYLGDAKHLGSIAATRSAKVVATAQPAIASIRDVAGDQGGSVRLRFRASPFDYRGSPTPITGYAVYRQVAAGLAPARANAPASVLLDGWDFLATLPATIDSAYVVVAPTLADSGLTGFHRATFMVRALTASPAAYFDSAPDSGWSVDNLPPATPAPFLAAYTGGATHLHWGRNAESDFGYYQLYHGPNSAFVPGPANLVATTSDTGWVDTGTPGGTYKLVAVDANGNASPAAVLTPANTSDAGGARLPAALALAPPSPSPAAGPVTLEFGLPRAAAVTVGVYDIGGRRVRVLASERLAAGMHHAAWDLRDATGAAVPGGLYFVRLTAGDETRQQRLAVVR